MFPDSNFGKMSLTLERPQHKNQKKTHMSMEGERRADWGRREERGMFCKVCEVYVTLCSTKSYIKYLCKKKKLGDLIYFSLLNRPG